MITRTLRQTVYAAVLAVAAVGQTLPLAEQLSGRLRTDSLKADVSFLASDALQGRATPSPELQIAAEFVAAQFRRAGLQPVGGLEYFQTAEFRSLTYSTEEIEVSFNVGGATLVVDKAAVYLPSRYLFNLELKGVPFVMAPADDAGWGALTPEQVRGNVIVAEATRLNRTAYEAFNRLAPAAVIMLRQPLQVSNSRPLLQPASPTTPPSRWYVMVWDAAVRKALATTTGGMISIKIPASTSVPLALRNVVGVLPGSDPSLRETYVLVTAHYDHLGVKAAGEGDRIFNGANDNASGTAAVIEIADALASLPQRPKRSIVFMAFFGEESGMLGSEYYTSHPLFPLENTVADVNLEELGRTDNDSGTRAGQVNATGFDFSSITEVLRQAALEANIQLVKDDKNNESYYEGSDNAAFAKAGVPATTLSIGYMFPDYHEPGDEWQKLDYNNMTNAARAIALGIYRLADGVDAPQWNKQNPKTQRYVQAQEKAAPGGKTE